MRVGEWSEMPLSWRVLGSSSVVNVEKVRGWAQGGMVEKVRSMVDAVCSMGE